MVCRPLGSTFPGLSVVLGPESDRLATCTNLGLELCLWTAGQAICTHQDLPLTMTRCWLHTHALHIPWMARFPARHTLIVQNMSVPLWGQDLQAQHDLKGCWHVQECQETTTYRASCTSCCNN